MRNVVGYLLVLATVLGSPACSKGQKEDEEEEQTSGDAPKVPAAGTLSIDLDIDDDQATLTGDAGLNYSGAMLLVGIVELNLAAQISIPVLLLKAAQATDPVYVAENTWTWSFDVAAGGNTWTANLTGTALTESTESWSMRVTNKIKDANACCTDFELFSGATSSASEGTWQIFDPKKPSTPSKLFQISYDYNTESDKKLSYLVNSDKAATEKFGNGSLVSFVVTDAAATMTYKDSAETGERIVTWDTTTKAGSHTDNTGAKLCWGPKSADYPNVACN